jgi:hypothetical protein
MDLFSFRSSRSVRRAEPTDADVLPLFATGIPAGSLAESRGLPAKTIVQTPRTSTRS